MMAVIMVMRSEEPTAYRRNEETSGAAYFSLLTAKATGAIAEQIQAIGGPVHRRTKLSTCTTGIGVGDGKVVDHSICVTLEQRHITQKLLFLQ